MPLPHKYIDNPYCTLNIFGVESLLFLKNKTSSTFYIKFFVGTKSSIELGAEVNGFWEYGEHGSTFYE